MPLTKPQRGHLLTVWELKQEARALAFSASAGNMHIKEQIFHLSAHGHE